MFSDNFFPTPPDVIERMLDGELIKGKIVLEPSAGKGDIVDYLLNEEAADVLAVELHPDLRAILATKCTLIGQDFLLLQSHQISHIHLIVMNPHLKPRTAIFCMRSRSLRRAAGSSRCATPAATRISGQRPNPAFGKSSTNMAAWKN